MRNITFLILAICLTGCATHSTLTVYSQPSGAYITESSTGKAYGIAPITVKYDAKAMNSYKDASGCFVVKGFEAKWVSGATTSSQPTIKLCGSNTGAYTYQLTRDKNAPDLDRDLDFALRQSAVRAQQAQAQAVQDSAAIQAWSALQASQPKPVAPITCNSYSVGTSVQTNCR